MTRIDADGDTVEGVAQLQPSVATAGRHAGCPSEDEPQRGSTTSRSKSEFSMDNMCFVAERGNERFEIVEGRGEGFYVFRFVNGENTHDFLQDDVPMAYRCAEGEWGVSLAAWRKALPGELSLWEQKA